MGPHTSIGTLYWVKWPLYGIKAKYLSKEAFFSLLVFLRKMGGILWIEKEK